MRLVYLGPFDSIEIPGIGVIKRDADRDLPEGLASELLASQPDSFIEAAPAAEKE